MNKVYIRSQDKEKLLTFDSGVLKCRKAKLFVVGTEEPEECCLIYYKTGSEVYDLGKYESVERCIEVLDEIQRKCGMYLKLEGGPALIRGGMEVQPAIFSIPRVYEMPEK